MINGQLAWLDVRSMNTTWIFGQLSQEDFRRVRPQIIPRKPVASLFGALGLEGFFYSQKVMSRGGGLTNVCSVEEYGVIQENLLAISIVPLTSAVYKYSCRQKTPVNYNSHIPNQQPNT